MPEESRLCEILIPVRTDYRGVPPESERRRGLPESELGLSERIIRDYGQQIKRALRHEPLLLPVFEPATELPRDSAELKMFRIAANRALLKVLDYEINGVGLIRWVLSSKWRLFFKKCGFIYKGLAEIVK